MSPSPRLARPDKRDSRLRGRRASLDVLELHAWTASGNLNLSIAGASNSGASIADVGLLAAEPGVPAVRAQRGERADGAWPEGLTATALRLKLPSLEDGDDASLPASVTLDLALDPLVEARGLRLARGSGPVSALGWTRTLEDALVLVTERHMARRPYAWARAALIAHHEDLPLVCLVETARTRAGSLVLPELARLRFLGPGAQKLPRSLSLSPLPARAEYGTGRLRAVAIAPRHRITVELTAPTESTALFEVVDPGGEAAYAHRALGARAEILVERAKTKLFSLEARARYEWGARAGDPRVPHRAWRG